MKSRSSLAEVYAHQVAGNSAGGLGFAPRLLCCSIGHARVYQGLGGFERIPRL